MCRRPAGTTPNAPAATSVAWRRWPPGPAIAARLRARGLDVDSTADVVDLIRSGNAAALQEVRQAGRVIGAVLATCVNLLNPSVIVIGGPLAEAGEHLLAGVREVVYHRSPPLATQHLRISPSHTGRRAGVRGASAMVIQAVLAPEAVDALLVVRAEHADGLSVPS